MKTRIGLLSGGQRQAVTLMATINTPRVRCSTSTRRHSTRWSRALRSHHAGHRGGKSHRPTMMVTHNIGAALSLGTRTIMLERGRIVLDLSGETRDRLDVPVCSRCRRRAARSWIMTGCSCRTEPRGTLSLDGSSVPEKPGVIPFVQGELP